MSESRPRSHQPPPTGFARKMTRHERKLAIMRHALGRHGGVQTLFGGVDKDGMGWAKPKPVTLPKLHFMRELEDAP